MVRECVHGLEGLQLWQARPELVKQQGRQQLSQLQQL